MKNGGETRSDLQATLKRVDSQGIATPKPPSSHLHATLKPRSSHLVAGQGGRNSAFSAFRGAQSYRPRHPHWSVGLPTSRSHSLHVCGAEHGQGQSLRKSL